MEDDNSRFLIIQKGQGAATVSLLYSNYMPKRYNRCLSESGVVSFKEPVTHKRKLKVRIE